MTLAILGIVGTVLSAVWWLAKRSIEKADTPEAIAQRKREAIARNIIKGDSLAESVRLNDSLRALRNRSERQGGNHPEGGSNHDRAA